MAQRSPVPSGSSDAGSTRNASIRAGVASGFAHGTDQRSNDVFLDSPVGNPRQPMDERRDRARVAHPSLPQVGDTLDRIAAKARSASTGAATFR